MLVGKGWHQSANQPSKCSTTYRFASVQHSCRHPQMVLVRDNSHSNRHTKRWMAHGANSGVVQNVLRTIKCTDFSWHARSCVTANVGIWFGFATAAVLRGLLKELKSRLTGLPDKWGSVPKLPVSRLIGSLRESRTEFRTLSLTSTVCSHLHR